MSMAAEYPEYATQITSAAKASFLAGDTQAYMAGIIFVLIGVALVFFLFLKRDGERGLLAQYHEQDMAAIITPEAASDELAAHTSQAM